MKKNIEDIQIKKPKITTILRKDIASSDDKRIRPPASMTKESVSPKSIPPKESGSRISTTPRVKRGPIILRRPILITLLCVLFLGVFYWSMTLFEHARVNINAKHQTFTLDHAMFTASKADKAPIGFEIMIVSDTQYKDMVLTDSKDVSLKATGQVTLFNEYSTKAVTIAARSYLSDNAGKTYLTDKAVTIPGYTIGKTDKKIIAGTATASISAFLPGSSYNGTPTDFTFNAYKNTPKYTKIYAKAKTMLTGGAEGLSYSLTPEEKGILNASANSTFKNSLLKKVTAQVPSGYILYDDALQFSYHLDDAFMSKTPNAKIPMDGTVSAVILSKSDLAVALIKHLLPKSENKEIAEIQLPDIEALSYGFSNTSVAVDKDMQSVSFTLTGQLQADWNPDIDALRSTLSGASYTSVTSIFAIDPGIATATVRLFPPWQKNLPIKTSKIDIRVQ